MLRRHLENGEIVRLGDFGAFQVSITGEGAETEEAFNSSLIKNEKIVFRLCIDLKDMLLTLRFEKMK